MSLFDRASAEIIALHRFFVEWFDKVTSAKADFGRFEAVMGEGMRMIAPDGAILDRDAIVAHVRDSRATLNGDFSIEIADIRPVWESGGAIVVTYIERQQRAGAKTNRRSTALFIESSSSPSGVEWRHLHETWMQTADN